MCTAVAYRKNHSYFGRNLDLERGYGEKVIITPRNYEIKFRCSEAEASHSAMIGTGIILDNFPLYFEAVNEEGLGVAALNFPNNAEYIGIDADKENIAPFEFIPWILSRCKTVSEARGMLLRVNVANLKFSEDMPLSPLHWIISDKDESIVAEPLSCGLKIYDNPFEVLTNNPPFDYHKTNVNNYMNLNTGAAVSHFSKKIPTENYSLGMGALGLPGDFSSASRFVRALFVKENSYAENREENCVNQFFHILDSVSMPRGCVLSGGNYEYTRYSSCINLNTGAYYCKTYDNFNILSVNMRSYDLDGSELFAHEIGLQETTFKVNER